MSSPLGDTKAGTFIAKDRYGNSYYENNDDELPRMPISRQPKAVQRN